MRSYTYLLLAALWVGAMGDGCEAFAASPGAGLEKSVPAVNEIDRRLPLGRMPYEMTWVDREEDPNTLIDFENLAGWTLDLYGGAAGALSRSREQQLWGLYVGKVVYSGTRAESRAVARPPKPVPIPDRFDSIDLWGYGDRLPGSSGSSKPSQVYLAILIQDARGKEFRFPLTNMRWVDWWLIHHKGDPETIRQITWPARFAGIEIAMGVSPEQRYLYLDSLAFYVENLKPLTFKPQPKRNLKPFRGQIAGLNTGPGTLPFPTREETILPANFEKEYSLRTRRTGRNRFEFEYRGRDARVVYEYRPKTGNLGEITARVDRGQPFRPLDGGGVRTPGGLVVGQLMSARLENDVLAVQFDSGKQVVEYNLRLWQKSLVLDVWCDSPDAAELHFGRVAGVRDPKLITVPYITYSHFNPRVLMSRGSAGPVFTSIWFDWYRSNASEPYFVAEPKIEALTAELNGGLRYIPKTDGRRNNLYERVFVTVSPVYEETLPTIANPPSLRKDEGKQVVWTVTQPESFREDHERCRRIRSYGLDKIMQHSHEVTWRDHNESYTMRLKAAPQKGGDKMLQWYIKAQNDLGWLQGVYSNYCDFAPVNTNWNPDFVQRMPNGEWRRAWYRTYAMKPAKAVEMDEYYAPRIKEKFGVKMSYTDVHTDNPPPWEYCDYDARVPGAGTFAATYYAYGQLLLNDQKVYGPTQSESTFQWLFAGLQSGGYGWVYTDVNLLTHPLDVSFRLHKMNPLECDYGMGYTNYYLSRLDPDWKESPKRREYVDLFLATTIGYGNMGWLVTDWGLDDAFGVEVMARSYYMMQQLQQQYAFEKPRIIQYAGRDGGFLTPSEAHATGLIADSRLHVEYENGTHVYVNRGVKGTWTVKSGQGEAAELPPSGWLAYNRNNGFQEFSALADGRRIDYVKSEGYEFLDGRGTWTERGSLGCAGSVARRQKGKGVIELIDIYGNNRIAFRAGGPGILVAYDPQGRTLGQVTTSSPLPGWRVFDPVAGARSYVYTQ